MRGLPIVLGVVLGGAAFASDFVGARRCKSCHEAEYAQWKATPHARAFSRLPRERRRDPRCTVCHATSSADGLVGVQCESCHGAGRYYWPEFIMVDTELARAVGLMRGDDEAICRRCHTADSPALVPFDAEAALARFRHNPRSKR